MKEIHRQNQMIMLCSLVIIMYTHQITAIIFLHCCLQMNIRQHCNTNFGILNSTTKLEVLFNDLWDDPEKIFQVDGSSFVINEVKRFCDPVTRVIKTPKGTGVEDTEV